MSLWSTAASASHAVSLACQQAQALGVSESNDARILLAHAAGLERNQLHRLDLSDFTESLEQRYLTLVARRAAGEPVSKILGFRDFWKHRFLVTEDVLDPRPETEVLVAEALSQPFTRVLDLGVGSGAILLSLLADRPAATGIGADLSQPALEVAARNAAALGLSSRAEFRRSDWYSGVDGMFDLIVSNPPYIALEEMAGLSTEVRAHDPRMALTDEADGLTAYRAIAAQARKHLLPQGRLIVEIGPSQGKDVVDLFNSAGFTSVAILKDLDGRDRVVRGIHP